MSMLKNLKVSKRERTIQVDPRVAARAKLVERLEEQIKLAGAIVGEPYTPTATRWVTDPSTGERVKKEVEIKPRKWFWSEMDKYYLAVRYANKPLALHGKGKGTTIEVGKLKDLVPTLELIRDAAAAGEVDEAISAVAKRS